MKRYASKTALVALLALSVLGSVVAVGLARPEVARGQSVDKKEPSSKPVAPSQDARRLHELEGNWRMIQFEADGQKQSVKDKGWLWKWRGPLVQRTGPGGKWYWSAAHILGTAGHLDLVFLDGDLKGELNAQTVPCLFKLDRGKLIICLRHETHLHWGRPVDFATDHNSWQVVLTFERAEDPLTLKGNWVVAEMYVNGSRLDEMAARVRGTIDRRVVFDDAKMSAESLADGKRIEAAYKLDPNKDPKRIVLSGPGPKPVPGIYRMDFDTLRLCFEDQANDAPNDFTSREGSRRSLWILKRETSP
jgi:uncharacterized protein (TIGR03067 family)